MAFDSTRRHVPFASLATLLSLLCLLWVGCSGSEAPPAEQAEEQTAPPPGADAADLAMPGDEADGEVAAAEEPGEEPLPPGEAPFETTYLDADSELFVHAQVAAILDSPLVQTLTGGDLASLDQITQQIGVKPNEIESVTVGVVNVAGLREQSSAAFEQFNPMGGLGPAGMGAGFPPDGTGFDPAMTVDSAELAMPAGDPAMPAGDPAAVPPGTGGGASPAANGAPGAKGPSAASKTKVVAVVRTSSPVNLEGLEGERLQHGDKAYYREKSPTAGEAGCVYLAEPSVLIVADEASIKQIIDEGEERARPTADLSFVKTLPQLLIAVASRDNKTLLKDLGAAEKASGNSRQSDPAMTGYAGAPGDDEHAAYEAEMAEQYETEHGELPGYESGSRQPGMQPLKPDQKLFEDHTQAVAWLVNLSQGIDVNVALRCDSAESAGKIQTEVDRNFAQIREQFEAAKQTLPGVIQQIAQPLVDSLAVQSDASVVRVSTQLPQEKQSLLAMLPMAVMGMMMSGGMQMDPEFETMTSRRELAQAVIDEGQAAANADELPTGLQVKGLARWGESPYGDQAPPPLEIGIVAVEGPAAQAIAFGKMELAEARLDGERQLKWLGTATDATQGDALRGFVPIERDGMFSAHPDDGVVTGFLLAPPADASSSLQSVSGQFQLQIAGRTEDVLLTNLEQLRGPIDDERLASAQMSVDASRAAQGQVEISWNESPLIGQVELVTADGAPLQNAGTTTFSTGGRTTKTLSLAGPPPQDLALRVVTYSDLQEVAVPFSFENLPLPEPQQLSEQQQALLVWTRGESPKDHPDLIIEAQGRWRDLQPIAPAATSTQNNRFGYPGSGFPGSDGVDPSMELEMEMAAAAEMEQQFESAPGNFPGSDGEQAAGRSRRAPTSDEPLRIVIDLIGPLAESAEALGEVDVTSVKSDIDTDLTFEGARLADIEGDPVEGFIDVTQESVGVVETPPGALRVIVNLTPPNQAIGGLAQVNGSLKLRTVRERTEAILTDLQDRIGPPQQGAPMAQKLMTDRELIKFGLKPAVAIGPNRVMMRLVEGKDERISGVSLIDLNGVPITNANASVSEGSGNARGRKVYAFDFPGGVPQKIGMRISVNMGVKDITIPIRLRDLPLPPLPEDEG